jgi:hypothetical protein
VIISSNKTEGDNASSMPNDAISIPNPCTVVSGKGVWAWTGQDKKKGKSPSLLWITSFASDTVAIGGTDPHTLPGAMVGKRGDIKEG